jgi:hypothetical protein
MSMAPTTIHAPARPQLAEPPKPAPVYVLADARGRFLTLASTPNNPMLSPHGGFAMTFATSHDAAWWLGDATRACGLSRGFPSLFVEEMDPRFLDPSAALGRAIG